MNRRTLSNLGPPLLMAAAILAASALVKAAPHAVWAAVAAPLLLVAALLATDVADRRAGGRPLPLPSALALSALLLAACGIVASAGLDRLAEMIPILGACAALPAIQRAEGARRLACRRA